MVVSLVLMIVAIDVSLDTLDVAYFDGNERHHKVFPNNELGFQQMLKWCRAARRKIVFCMEATGSYSTDVAEFLHNRGYTVYVENAKLIKSFRDSENERTSTDKTNAFSIARYAAAHLQKMNAWQPLPPHLSKLRQLIRLRDSLVQNRIEWSNRRSSRSFAGTLEYIERILKEVSAAIKDVEKHIRSHVKENAELTRSVKLLRSIKGIGDLTAWTILAEVPVLSLFKNKGDLVAFAGLNPKLRTSGKSIEYKPRLSKQGNSRLRKALYMPAVTALRSNPRIRELAGRLKEKGMHPMAIVGAAMRRLLCFAFGVLHSGRPLDAVPAVTNRKVA